MNEDLIETLKDLEDAIFSVGLGDEEDIVIKAAKKALVRNWNETHSGDEQITPDEERALLNSINED